MSADTITNRLNCKPPRSAATDPGDDVKSGAVSAAAAALDLWTGYAAGVDGSKTPQGKVLVEFEALGATSYVRFARTGTTATTTANGAAIVVGTPRVFYLDPTKDLFVDVIASGAGTLKWRVVGPIGERNRV